MVLCLSFARAFLLFSFPTLSRKLTLVEPPAQQGRVGLRARARDHQLERVGDVDGPCRGAHRAKKAARDAGCRSCFVSCSARAADFGASDVVGDVDDDELLLVVVLLLWW